jgi:hypothetical protein
MKLMVQNTGSSPFYLDWPVAVALLDPATKQPVHSAVLEGVDIRQWLPGEDWDSAAFAYRRAAVVHRSAGRAKLPADVKPGSYIIAVAILDRQGGLVPSARFAMANYVRGGWHPLGMISIGQAPGEAALRGVSFDSPAFDDSLSYKVPERLRMVKAPPLPSAKAVSPWTADPKKELIDPWRYWTLEADGPGLDKEIRQDGPEEGPAGRRVMRVTGDFGKNSRLDYIFGSGVKLDSGRYRLTCRVRGTAGQSAEFELADGWRRVAKSTAIPLTEEWEEHSVEFEIKETFKDETTLRFRLPRQVKGTFELADTRLKLAE